MLRTGVVERAVVVVKRRDFSPASVCDRIRCDSLALLVSFRCLVSPYIAVQV